MTDQVGGIAQHVGHPDAIQGRVVRQSTRQAAPMSGAIRDVQLEARGLKCLLGAEVVFTTGLTALGTAMNQHQARACRAPARDVYRRSLRLGRRLG